MCCVWSASLLTLCIRAGVIISVTFQQVDHAPNAKTGSEGNDEGLQHIDCAIEEIHILCAGIVSLWFLRWKPQSRNELPLCAAVDSGFSFQIFGCAFLRLCVSLVSAALSASSFTEWVSDVYIYKNPPNQADSEPAAAPASKTSNSSSGRSFSRVERNFSMSKAFFGSASERYR